MVLGHSNFGPITFGSFSSPSNGVASPTSAFIDGFRLLQKQLDEQVAKLHIRALWECEFVALFRAQVKVLDFKRTDVLLTQEGTLVLRS